MRLSQIGSVVESFLTACGGSAEVDVYSVEAILSACSHVSAQKKREFQKPF